MGSTMSSVAVVLVICTRLELVETASFSPPSSGFFHDIDGISVAPGNNHICALAVKHNSDVGGRARCWGDEEEEGKTDPPKDVTFVQLVSGSSFSCGITISQTVECWGGMHGQQIPDRVPGLFTQITASDLYACGVRTDGSILCWGHSHVLAHVPPSGFPSTKTTRAHNAGNGLKFVQVSCSEHHCCGLDNNAHAHCFGYGDSWGEVYPPIKSNFTATAKMGVKNTPPATKPIGEEEEDEDEYEDEIKVDMSKAALASQKAEEVLLSRLQFKQISVGEGISCGLTLALGSGVTDSNGATYKDGDMVCWGNNKGHSNLAPHTQGPYKQVSVGPLGVCALFAADAQNISLAHKPHAMQCWGFVNNILNATEVPASSWDQVAVGSLSVCAVTMVSELQCWGTGLHDVQRRPLDIEIA